ncbi:UNVERIFIED_CONTAM: hypothetical protein FKN15_013366 [Acipenser sinensis]
METSQSAESREFQYPAELRSAQARKHHKLSVLREKPECLYTDYKKRNLIFYTQHLNAWHTAVCKTYSNVTKRGICQGRQILFREDSDPDSTVLSINVYHSGTLQHNTRHQPAHPYMRECLALLELEFVEFRELTLARLTETSITQQLRDEVSQLKRENRVAITELTSDMKDLQQENESLRTQLTSEMKNLQQKNESLRTQLTSEMKDLQQENESLRTQLTSVKEEMQRREKTINKELQGLREQLQRYTAPPTPAPRSLLPAPRSLLPAPRSLHLAPGPCSLHLASRPFSMLLAPSTLLRTPCSPLPSPCTLNPAPFSLHPAP